MHYRKLSEIVADRRLLHAAPDMSVQDAARAMRDRDVSAVVVLAADGGLSGIVTERDIASRLVAEGLDGASTPLSAIMTSELHIIADDHIGLDAVRMMDHHRIRHLIVRLSGGGWSIVSQRDFSAAELAAGHRLHEQASGLWESL